MLRDTSQIFDIQTRNFGKFRLFGILGPLFGAMSRSGGSTKTRVMRDLDQISTSTQGCVMCDCRFDRNSTVYGSSHINILTKDMMPAKHLASYITAASRAFGPVLATRRPSVDYRYLLLIMFQRRGGAASGGNGGKGR
jgi:hypothetical protein